MAKKKSKGRPPKFVLDEHGKEVYGLSYNNSTRMYYATFSDPRVYFSAGGKTEDRKKNAIDKYQKWAEGQQLSAEQQNEREELNRIYEKARQLLSDDECIQEEIKEKAKELLEEAEEGHFLSRDYGRFANLVNDKASDLIKSGQFDDKIVSKFEDLLRDNSFEKKITAEIKKLIDGGSFGHFKKFLWEMLYDQISTDPVKTAKMLGIPQLAFISLEETETNSPWSYTMTWDLAWKIFKVYKPKKKRLFDERWYRFLGSRLSYKIGEEDIAKIDTIDLLQGMAPKESYTDEIFSDPCKDIPMEGRLELIEEVFLTVKQAGFPQAAHMLSVVKSLYNKVCK